MRLTLRDRFFDSEMVEFAKGCTEAPEMNVVAIVLRDTEATSLGSSVAKTDDALVVGFAKNPNVGTAATNGVNKSLAPVDVGGVEQKQGVFVGLVFVVDWRGGVEDRGDGGKSLVVGAGGVEGVKVEEEYGLAVYLDKDLLAGECGNEALVGKNATAAFLFDPGLSVGQGQFDEVEVAGGMPPVPV
ncbi:uncharacterized protein LACBIDRAFT_329660 [Laccaria bicolor S238N-H82]|uniref:Predicted protein n=1 Tax=Laccaria bicolor (strain S238N-H82 / ATCC MYA-4686) TaxID=486041 RepID=B0DIR2_LACBS|nr:uncharacterized protein LACBIDRAFT_329660 [Laccaria bicolor S238N-H82]EDR05615.1 predicted protein [Laccaria bicolor S238N-H82]|eukprot:XP_001883719.1 predicted protein [Laccaria bicolor S238N-H82]